MRNSVAACAIILQLLGERSRSFAFVARSNFLQEIVPKKTRRATNSWECQLYTQARDSSPLADPRQGLYSVGATEIHETESGNKLGEVVFILPSVGSDTIKAKFGSRSPVGNPPVQVAAEQLARKIDWFSDGLVSVFLCTPEEASMSAGIAGRINGANCLFAYHLSSEKDLKFASTVFETRQNVGRSDKGDFICQFALECSPCEGLGSLVGPYVSSSPSLTSRVLPWTKSASARRLEEAMSSLFTRWTSDDFTVAVMLFFDLFSGRRIPWVQHSIDATWEKGPIQNAKEFYSMVTNCGDCIVKCVNDDTCKTCIDKLTELDSRDQVASYRTIVSYESELLKDFSFCILQKHNIFQCDAVIPERPYVPPIASWRGREMTQEAARQILIGHLDDEDAPDGSQRLDVSWKVAAGANVAYDQFPSQNQIFYKSVGRDMWYDPVFRVETVDGRNVWAKRHYKVRDGSNTGTFRFSVLDNGITSNEFWTIAGVADDLSWIVFHYAGAASNVGQRYLGGLLCTPSGELPPPEKLPAIWDVMKATGIEPWELFVVDNREDSEGALEAGKPPLDFFRRDVARAKALKAAA